jgi:hypothetical protein
VIAQYSTLFTCSHCVVIWILHLSCALYVAVFTAW